MMSPDERLAVQRVVMDWLQADAAENPTRLIDVLLSGDGCNLVHHVLSTRAQQARETSRAMDYLLQAMVTDGKPVPAPPAAAPAPIVGDAIPPPLAAVGRL